MKCYRINKNKLISPKQATFKCKLGCCQWTSSVALFILLSNSLELFLHLISDVLSHFDSIFKVNNDKNMYFMCCQSSMSLLLS